MKKTFLIFLSIMLIIPTLTACNLVKKERADLPTFEAISINAGLRRVSVDTTQLPSYDDVSALTNADNSYQVEFYDMSSSGDAQTLFNTIKQEIEASHSDFTTTSNINGTNYTTKQYTIKNCYHRVTVVEDTVFYGYTETDGSTPIVAISNELGY